MKFTYTGQSEKSPPMGLLWSTARQVLNATFALAPAFLAVGCSKPATELCELFCECEGCTQSAYEQCLGDGEGAVAEAEKAGCSSQYDDYLSCVVEEAECRDDEHFTFDGCTVEQKALSKCGNLGLNACDQAAQKLCGCKLGCESGPTAEQCTGQVECQAKCMAVASCSDIINQPFGSDYANCLSSC